MYNQKLHPHQPAGAATGGEFAPSKGSGQGAGKGNQQGKGTAHHTGTLSYDPHSNTGTGYNSKGGDSRVKSLQDSLNRLGLTDSKGKKLVLDGKLGPLTTQAVMAAQKRLGVAQDGKVTPALLHTLTTTKALPVAPKPKAKPKRSLAVAQMCVRAFDFEFEDRAAAGDGRTLEGYAAVFDHVSRIADHGGDFDEVIKPGAFARSLGARTPVLQFEHGRDPRVGAVPIGAIEDIREDSRGLYVRARLFDNPVVEPVRQAIQGRAIKGMSFRFGVPDGGDTWTKRTGDVELREIHDTDTRELGPVVFPAYDTTTVTVRSLLAQLDPDEYRALIREVAAEMRSAVDLTDLTTEHEDGTSTGGDAPNTEPGNGDVPVAMSIRQRLDDGALRARQVIR